MCVINARTHGCVRNDSETHPTGATGLHDRRGRECNPVTQTRAFRCHFAHTHAFTLYKRWYCIQHIDSLLRQLRGTYVQITMPSVCSQVGQDWSLEISAIRWPPKLWLLLSKIDICVSERIIKCIWIPYVSGTRSLYYGQRSPIRTLNLWWMR